MIWDRIRKFENAHILLWLMKDTCWVMDFKLLGVIILFPTVAMAFYIAWISRSDKKEFLHNLAVCNWVLANSIWMIGEFFYNDTSRPLALIFFIGGFICISIYYLPELYVRLRRKK